MWVWVAEGAPRTEVLQLLCTCCARRTRARGEGGMLLVQVLLWYRLLLQRIAAAISAHVLGASGSAHAPDCVRTHCTRAALDFWGM
jgi:hypothetical protein